MIFNIYGDIVITMIINYSFSLDPFVTRVLLPITIVSLACCSYYLIDDSRFIFGNH